MKSFAPPLLLLTAILCFSIWNCNAMQSDTDRWSDQLEQVDALAVSGDWNLTLAGLADSYDDWTKQQTYLHIVSEHDVLDSTEGMYLRARAFARTEELTEFRAEIADLRNHLRLLSEMERFSIKNVL